MGWPKNGRVEATNPRSQRKREWRKGKVSTPGDGKRSKEPKPMEAKTEQTKENDPPKVSAESYAGSSLLSRSYLDPLLPRMMTVEKGGEVPSCQ
jgi:hypothetical protein